MMIRKYLPGKYYRVSATICQVRWSCNTPQSLLMFTKVRELSYCIMHLRGRFEPVNLVEWFVFACASCHQLLFYPIVYPRLFSKILVEIRSLKWLWFEDRWIFKNSTEFIMFDCRKVWIIILPCWSSLSTLCGQHYFQVKEVFCSISIYLVGW